MIAGKLLNRLSAQIEAVCPIRGVSADGLIDFADEATMTQRDEAYQVINSFDQVAALAEIEKEEAAEKARQEWLRTVVGKYTELKRHIQALEVAAHAIRPAFVPEEWE